MGSQSGKLKASDIATLRQLYEPSRIVDDTVTFVDATVLGDMEWVAIFKFLALDDWIRLRRVSKRWNQVLKYSTLWVQMLERNFPTLRSTANSYQAFFFIVKTIRKFNEGNPITAIRYLIKNKILANDRAQIVLFLWHTKQLKHEHLITFFSSEENGKICQEYLSFKFNFTQLSFLEAQRLFLTEFKAFVAGSPSLSGMIRSLAYEYYLQNFAIFNLSNIKKFDSKVKHVMEQLRFPMEAEYVALILRLYPGWAMERVGRYLGDKKNADVLQSYCDTFYLNGLFIVVALRLFLACFDLPGDISKKDAILTSFAISYKKQNPKIALEEQGVKILVPMIHATHQVFLNPDMMNKPSLAQFSKQVQDIPSCILAEGIISTMYEQIKEWKEN